MTLCGNPSESSNGMTHSPGGREGSEADGADARREFAVDPGDPLMVSNDKQ